MSSQALARYYAILEGERKARYLEAKQQITEANLGSSDALLWKVHENLPGTPRIHSGKNEVVSFLDLKAELARRMLRSCCLCERRCGVDRTSGEKGHCGVLNARVSSDFIHLGEEPDLVPSYTIFFSGCTFNCVFCQNWDISSRPESGAAVNPSDLAEKIDRRVGVATRAGISSRPRNVNWVGGDPTSNLPFILDVLTKCRANIPQVWNSNMYLSTETMKLLKGVIDVYLTDFKYGNDKCAMRLSNAPNYMQVTQRNHLSARKDSEVIVRHLVLPGHIDCCTKPVLTWIAENLKDVKVNVMAQYRPEHRAREFPDIARPLGTAEYRQAIEIADALGLDLCD